LGDETPIRAAPPSLKAAVRRARVEDAERSEVLAELRGAEIARLEMLQQAIEPVLAQAPEDVDLFDVGLAVGDRPRLFIDMIGFVEMGRDRRQYRFIQNMRHGRVVLAESEHLDKMVDAVTAYIARRLVEREKALASDAAFTAGGAPLTPPSPPQSVAAARQSATSVNKSVRREAGPVKRALFAGFDLFGSVILILVVATIVWFAWRLALNWRAGAP
jgi:hypothetical protein